MTDQRNNVLLPMPMPTHKALRAAVAKIVRRIQADHDLTDEDFAAMVGISEGTVANARKERTDINAATIAMIGAKFGVEALDPYAALYGARNVLLDVADTDAMPSLTGAVHRLAVAQSPSSKGGQSVTHCELLDMLPDLRSAQAAINSLIVRAERMAA